MLPARAPIALAYTPVPALSDSGIIWRVGDSAAPKSYATYRWASSPSDLVRQRLTERLSRQGPVLGERVNGQTPQLQVQLQQFEQVFAPDGASSQGRVVLQAVLVNGHKVLGQTRIAVQAPAPTQDAAGGWPRCARRPTTPPTNWRNGWRPRCRPPVNIAAFRYTA